MVTLGTGLFSASRTMTEIGGWGAVWVAVRVGAGASGEAREGGGRGCGLGWVARGPGGGRGGPGGPRRGVGGGGGAFRRPRRREARRHAGGRVTPHVAHDHR